jgi:hypothetical protein
MEVGLRSIIGNIFEGERRARVGLDQTVLGPKRLLKFRPMQAFTVYSGRKITASFVDR